MQVARLQAWITCTWLACLLAWVLVHLERPALAALGAVAIALSHAWVLALELLAQRWLSRNDPVPRASWGQLFRAWASEVMIAPQVFCWHQPFARLRHADALRPRAGMRGVVLVHGYLCNRGFWNPWMERLQRQGRPFMAVDLAPIFGHIDDSVSTIEAAVSRMTAATGLAPMLVGHSMGGLAIRAWLSRTGDPARVHKLVTLGSPHQGTWTAHFGHSPNARQLRPGSPWLQALNQTWPEVWAQQMVCFYSNADNMVFPPSCATLPGADNRLLQGLAHVQIAWRPEVMEAVLALCEPPAVR